MPVEFIGAIGTQVARGVYPNPNAPLDPAYLVEITRAHEKAGFDRALIGAFSTGPDGAQVAAHAFAHSRTLKLLLAHRPGFVSPTVAARQLATLDVFGGGRLAVHIVSGGNAQDLRRDGDHLAHDARYARTDEYLTLLRRIWTEEGGVDHDGDFFRVEKAGSTVQSVQSPHIPIFFGGSSDAAIRTAARHASVYALFAEPLDDVRRIIARVRASAADHGRSDAIGFSLSVRPILGATEEDAWRQARDLLEQTRAHLDSIDRFQTHGRPEAIGAQRLLSVAARGRVLDKRLWTELAPLLDGQGNITALVGTPEQVADSLLDYRDIGITHFLIRGFDPVPDALEYGRSLIPIVREGVAAREQDYAEAQR